MTCEQIERDEIAERYLLGRLTGDETERFESHYFECRHCLDRLQAMEAAQALLAREPARHGAGPAHGGKAPTAGTGRWWRTAAALAAAAVIVVAVRVLQPTPGDAPAPPGGQAMGPGEGRPAPPTPKAGAEPQVPWTRLGAIDPPAYSPMRLRSSASDAQRQFRLAMEAYVEKNYAAAAAGLRAAAALPGAPVDARFYLGVCELQAGRVEAAASAFERVIAAGESPYLEDAHFFLAKARIRQRDAAAARTHLLRVIALDGDRREEVRQLMSELPRP